jgi:orotidine-5'-phosphate decarboxylase
VKAGQSPVTIANGASARNLFSSLPYKRYRASFGVSIPFNSGETVYYPLNFPQTHPFDSLKFMRYAPANPVLTAIDTPELATAMKLGDSLARLTGGFKLGKEFFMAEGPQGVLRVAGDKTPLFLDLKLHDIPNTVAGAVRSVCRVIRPNMLTIHSSGGAAMIRAATDAAAEFGAARPWILAVTVLTSMDDSDLAATGISATSRDQVLRLAALARANGADGVICSPLEITALRAEFGPELKLVVPGIRPVGSDRGDQKRVKSPAEALADGADYLVIGRPITAAADPCAALSAILEGLN